MSDLLAEVDEAMRYERVEQFWKENGRFIIFLIIAVIVATASVSAYRAWDKNVKAEQTKQIFVLMEDASFPENLLNAELKLRPSLKAMILMQGGEKFALQNNPEKAIILYEKVANDQSIESDFRQLSTLMSLRLKMAQESPNGAELITQAETIINDKNSPWKHHAMLDAALVAGDVQSDYAQAVIFLNEILDTANIPETLRTRARALHHVYTLKNNENKNDQES